jgi:homogentisate 1,2-dioxygenase
MIGKILFMGGFSFGCGGPEAPFCHRNRGYEDNPFYHDGKFFSKDNMIPIIYTLPPHGLHHGPHPRPRAQPGHPPRRRTRVPE